MKSSPTDIVWLTAGYRSTTHAVFPKSTSCSSQATVRGIASGCCPAFSSGVCFRGHRDAFLWVRFVRCIARASNVWFQRLPADFALTAKLYAAGYAYTENIHPAFVKIEQMRIDEGTEDVLYDDQQPHTRGPSAPAK